MTAGPPRKPPPPLPPQARAAQPPAAPPPRSIASPAVGQTVSQDAKNQIAEMALGLLEEQVQARIVHYKADLETNPELDAITAQVVAQLKELQATHGHQTAGSRESIQASHERILTGLLERVFRPGAPSLLVERRLKDITRKLARLFFQSELHEKTRGNDGAMKVIQHGEQAIFYVLMRYEHRLKHDLGSFDYANDEIKERAFDLLAKVAKDMQDAFLSRRSSELKRIVSTFNAVLVEFFAKQLAPNAAEIAREVVVQSGSAEGRAFAYKVTAEAFPRFRAAFERRIMLRLVGYAEDHLLAKLADTAGAAREETVQFVTDPHLFSMIVGELCDGLYEFFCNEGFLDLPPDWRQAAAARVSMV
ncbi:MAG TPA: hypothetical protein VHB21_14295 [Minicystis sp.]|nr:hypothetical protein [Minicystis sp.]